MTRDRSGWTGKMGSLERAVDLCVEYADERLKAAENWTKGRVDSGIIDTAIAFYDRADRLRKEMERRGTNNV